jgi:hypothetical protein
MPEVITSFEDLEVVLLRMNTPLEAPHDLPRLDATIRALWAEREKLREQCAKMASYARHRNACSHWVPDLEEKP